MKMAEKLFLFFLTIKRSQEIFIVKLINIFQPSLSYISSISEANMYTIITIVIFFLYFPFQEMYSINTFFLHISKVIHKWL